MSQKAKDIRVLCGQGLDAKFTDDWAAGRDISPKDRHYLAKNDSSLIVGFPVATSSNDSPKDCVECDTREGGRCPG